MTKSGTKRNIVRNISGGRYLLTSRRIVELDSSDAKIGEPWYVTNSELRKAAEQLPQGYVTVKSLSPEGGISVVVSFGKLYGNYRIGCGVFDFTTFKRILRNAGVKGTQKKAFAAKAGA